MRLGAILAAVGLVGSVFAQDPQGESGDLLSSLAGLRPGTDEPGIELEGYTDLEFTAADGRDPSGRNLVSLGLSADLDELIGLRGGSAFLNLRSFNGSLASDAVGDFQGISSFDAEDADGQLSELWVAQKLWRDRLDIRAGLLDGGRFAALDKGADFFTSSIGTSPTILGFPTWPDTALGGELFIKPSDHSYLGMGLYHGLKPGSLDLVAESPDPRPATSGQFAIAEGGVVLPGRRTGRLGVGVWHNSDRFQRFDGGTQDGTGGVYALWEHHLWRESRYGGADEGLHAFALYGEADDAVSEAAAHSLIGVYYLGLIPRRDRDAVGLAMSRVDLSGAENVGSPADESIYELFYKAELTASTSLQLGIQYVDSVGGDPEEHALVLGLRMSVAL